MSLDDIIKSTKKPGVGGRGRRGGRGGGGGGRGGPQNRRRSGGNARPAAPGSGGGGVQKGRGGRGGGITRSYTRVSVQNQPG